MGNGKADKTGRRRICNKRLLMLVCPALHHKSTSAARPHYDYVPNTSQHKKECRSTASRRYVSSPGAFSPPYLSPPSANRSPQEIAQYIKKIVREPTFPTSTDDQF